MLFGYMDPQGKEQERYLDLAQTLSLKPSTPNRLSPKAHQGSVDVEDSKDGHPPRVLGRGVRVWERSCCSCLRGFLGLGVQGLGFWGFLLKGSFERFIRALRLRAFRV